MKALDPRIADALARLPDYLGGHVLVSIAALALGLAVSLPLALLAARRPAARRALLGFSGIVQTVPGLALLALFYPLLLALAALSDRLLGVSFSALGFLPSVLALALYSMLPVVRNTLTGLAEIDPAIRQAAVGVGMTPRQALWMVELPLALPVIMAGIRTAAVWVIGTATLATPVGQTSLGNYIFAGLQTQNWISVLVGCVLAAALAIVVDQMLALIETGVRLRGRKRVTVGIVGLALVVLAAIVPALHGKAAGYVIGTKPFTEQYVLAGVIEQRLKRAGHDVTQRDGLGSSIIFRALAAGEIDAFVDYSGTLWANEMRRTDRKPRDEMLAEIKQWLERRHGIALLGGLGFENAYALAMPRARATSLGITSLADLPRHAGTLTLAADVEFFGRPEWASVRDGYGLAFRTQRQMSETFMYAAAASGEADVIVAYTSDGRIAQQDLLVLEDPKQAIPPYDAVLLVSRKRAADVALVDTLKPLIGAIDVTRMREANRRAIAAGGSPDEAARWLSDEIGRSAR
jgi:glycine betaine/choline ABC-type transport system substrate-binding protein/ABC-type proline/glycine betaine transport system permease subunit